METITMDFGRKLGGPVLTEGYDATRKNPARISVTYTPTATGVSVQYSLHEALFPYNFALIRNICNDVAPYPVIDIVTKLMENTRNKRMYEAWPTLFMWMYSWKATTRKLPDSFAQTIRGDLMPLLDLADFLNLQELIYDLIILVRNEEQAGNKLDTCLTSGEITAIANRLHAPSEFQDLCDHWKCNKAQQNGTYQCQNIDRNGACQEANHRFGIGSFELEHWTSGCVALKNRTLDLRQMLKHSRKEFSRWESEAVKNEAANYEPPSVRLTCKHFSNTDGRRILNSLPRGS